MKILITGCIGNVGKIATEGFLNEGWEVRGLDIKAGKPREHVEYIIGDIKDFDTVMSAVEGCDAVLHLAAYGMPYLAEQPEMFQVNVAGTFHVFEACQRAGIRFLTVASSVNAIGYNFGITLPKIEEVPVSSGHSLYTTDMYSYSKECIESIGRYYWRRYGISSIFMRFGLDFTKTIEEWMSEEKGPSEVRALHRRLEELLKLPKEEAAQKVQKIEDDMNARRKYAFEKEEKFQNGIEYVYDEFDKEQEIWSYYIHNFMMFLDRRDMADAFLCSEQAKPKGCHVVFVADHKNMLGIETAKAAELCYPKAKLDSVKLQGFDAVIDYRETEELIGFRAKHSFEQYYDFLYGKKG